MIRAAIIGLAIVAMLSAFGITYRAGYRSATEKCNAAALQAQLDAAKDDLAKANERLAQEAQQTQQLRKGAQDAEGRLNDLEAELLSAREREESQPAPAPVDGRCPAPPRARDGASDRDLRELRTYGPD